MSKTRTSVLNEIASYLCFMISKRKTKRKGTENVRIHVPILCYVQRTPTTLFFREDLKFVEIKRQQITHKLNVIEKIKNFLFLH